MPRQSLQGQHFSVFDVKITVRIKPSLSFEHNKTYILDEILANNEIVDQIVKKIDSIPNFETLSEEKKEFLKKLKKKLVITPKIEGDKQKIEEINEIETNFLQKSIEFIMGRTPLSFSEEKNKTIREMNENCSIIPIELNLMRGFDDSNDNEEQQSRIEETNTEESQFICPNHGIICTLYCENCKKLICPHEIFPFDNSQQGMFS